MSSIIRTLSVCGPTEAGRARGTPTMDSYCVRVRRLGRIICMRKGREGDSGGSAECVSQEWEGGVSYMGTRNGLWVSNWRPIETCTLCRIPHKLTASVDSWGWIRGYWVTFPSKEIPRWLLVDVVEGKESSSVANHHETQKEHGKGSSGYLLPQIECLLRSPQHNIPQTLLVVLPGIDQGVQREDQVTSSVPRGIQIEFIA